MGQHEGTLSLLLCGSLIVLGALFFVVSWLLSNQIHTFDQIHTFHSFASTFFRPPDLVALHQSWFGHAVAPIKPISRLPYPKMSQTSVMIALIGRDVATELPFVLRNIEALGRMFKQSHVVLVENDSRDATPSIFLKWAKKYNSSASNDTLTTAQLISFKSSLQKKEIRVLAAARNRYIEAFVAANTPKVMYDYLIAVDADMCFEWEVEKMSRAIEDLLPTSAGWFSSSDPIPEGSIVWDALRSQRSVRMVRKHLHGSCVTESRVEA